MKQVIDSVHSRLALILLDLLQSEVINDKVKYSVRSVVSVETDYLQVVMLRHSQQVATVLGLLGADKSIVAHSTDLLLGTADDKLM